MYRCSLLNGSLSHQIKLRLLRLEFTAQAEVISPFDLTSLPTSGPTSRTLLGNLTTLGFAKVFTCLKYGVRCAVIEYIKGRIHNGSTSAFPDTVSRRMIKQLRFAGLFCIEYGRKTLCVILTATLEGRQAVRPISETGTQRFREAAYPGSHCQEETELEDGKKEGLSGTSAAWGALADLMLTLSIPSSHKPGFALFSGVCSVCLPHTVRSREGSASSQPRPRPHARISGVLSSPHCCFPLIARLALGHSLLVLHVFSCAPQIILGGRDPLAHAGPQPASTPKFSLLFQYVQDVLF